MRKRDIQKLGKVTKVMREREYAGPGLRPWQSGSRVHGLTQMCVFVFVHACARVCVHMYVKERESLLSKTDVETVISIWLL